MLHKTNSSLFAIRCVFVIKVVSNGRTTEVSDGDEPPLTLQLTLS
jgi:hypothetical protein